MLTDHLLTGGTAPLPPVPRPVAGAFYNNITEIQTISSDKRRNKQGLDKIELTLPRIAALPLPTPSDPPFPCIN